jgi:hypothetical protein
MLSSIVFSIVDRSQFWNLKLKELSWFVLTYFFLITTRIREFLLDIDSAYNSFVWIATILLDISGCNNIVSILLLYLYYYLLISGNFEDHRTLVSPHVVKYSLFDCRPFPILKSKIKRIIRFFLGHMVQHGVNSSFPLLIFF